MFTERAQTLREEIANAISHGLGFLLAVASAAGAGGLLVAAMAGQPRWWAPRSFP